MNIARIMVPVGLTFELRIVGQTLREGIPGQNVLNQT
jgi:hypothetical protein